MVLEVGSAVLRTAVPSLLELLKYEWCLNKTVKDGLRNLKDELMSMHAFLGDVSGMPPDQLESQVKIRARQVTELSHAIETRLHSFRARIESAKGTFHSAPSKLFINHQMDNYIKETLTKVKEVRGLHGPYPSKSSLESSTSEQEGGTRMFAMDTRESNPVGLDGAIADLTKKLSKGDNVSIVGMGGMGKTTLARALYDKMKDDFDCAAFVPIGQRVSMKNILTYIFDELHIEMYGHEPDQQQLTKQLQHFLVNKRCLIVIDDVWDEKTWTLVEGVFKDSVGAKIITTTRNLKVAEKVGGVYPIEPLSPGDSKKLLRDKAEAKSHDTEFDIVSDKILSKCGGVPIAITMIGSLLAKNQSKEWHRVYDSIGFDEHEDEALENVRKVLSYSYYVLPYETKKCFLYLSLFPENHWIEKNMLIWRWVAEGLVSDGLFETGEKRFIELIDRCMIQWAASPRDVGQGGCRVHGLMLDLIRDLSSSEKENFSTILGMKQESPSQTIHRLAIHEGQNQNTSLELEVGEVLSIYANTCAGSSFPALRKFKRVRVIDLEGCDLSVGDCKLNHLGKLDGLGYIGLVGTPVAKLPKKIGRLKLLQTLDVRATGISELSSFVEDLRNLRCLRAGKGTRMMGRIGELACLEELWLHSADKSPDFAMELRKLTKMRVLVIHFDEMDGSMQEALVVSLHQLKKLQVLQVWSDAEERVRLGCWEGSLPSPELRQLLLFGVVLPRPMPWIHKSCVPKLSKLLLQVEVLRTQDLEILGQMPSLLSLYLHIEEEKYRLSYTAGKDEFKVLEYLNTNIELICGSGALPRIQELEVGGIRVGMDPGLRGNMPLLERVTYHLDCMGCGPAEVHKAEQELMQASRDHPNRPTISIKRWNNFVLEMQDQFVRPVWRALVGPLDEGYVLSPAFAKLLSDNIARAMQALGAPPTLALGLGDATDGTGSSSQGSDTATTFYQDAAHKQMWNDFQQLMITKTAACMGNKDAPPSSSDIHTIVQLIMSDAITHFSQNVDGPQRVIVETFNSSMGFPTILNVLYTAKQGWGHGGLEIDTKVLLNNACLAFSAMTVEGQAYYKSSMKEFAQSQIPEFGALLDSTCKKATPWSIRVSDLQRSMKAALPYSFGFLAEEIDALLKRPDDGACEGLAPKVGTLLSWFNTPDGAACFSEMAAALGVGPVTFSRMVEECLRNPEIIALYGDTSAGQLFQAMFLRLCADIIDDIFEQYMDGQASMQESCQAGENILTRWEQLVADIKEEYLAADASDEEKSKEALCKGFLAGFDMSIANSGMSATDAARMRNAMEKCLQNPEFAVCMKPGSRPNFSLLAKVMAQEVMSCVTTNLLYGPGMGQDAGTNSLLAENSCVCVSGEPPRNFELDADSMRSFLDSPEMSELSEVGTALGVGPFALRRMFEKCMRNPEMAATMRRGYMSESELTMMLQLVLTELMDYAYEQYMPASMPLYGDAAQGMGAPPTENFSNMMEQVFSPAARQAHAAAAAQPTPKLENIEDEEGAGAGT